LEWFTGLSIDSNNHTVGVTGEIDSDLNLDLAELFLNLFLLLGFASLDVRTKLARDAGNLTEEGEFAFVENALLDGEARDQVIQEAVECRLERIGLMRVLWLDSSSEEEAGNSGE
jgi:hypothetical protein